MNINFRRLTFSSVNSLFSTLRLSLLLGICIAVSSCGKEKISLDWVELDSGTAYPLTSVHFTDVNNGHAVGGETWYRGAYIHTADGGETWQADTLGDKQLFGIHFNQENIGHAVGINGYLFRKETVQSDWVFYRLPRWNFLRDVCFTDEGYGTVVGGSAYNFGIILTMNPNYNTFTLDTLENELSAVSYSDKNTIHAAGYGIILRSTDAGQNWTVSETNGDFYKSISFPTNTIGYIVGYSGSILKTTDAGQSWEKLIDGDKITVKNTPFRSAHFVNAEKGYLVGDNGTFWRTIDGGENWQVVEDFPDTDLYDVFVVENTGYIVGENGRIFRFEE